MKQYQVYVRITYWTTVEGESEDDACERAEGKVEDLLDGDLPGAHVDARDCKEVTP